MLVLERTRSQSAFDEIEAELASQIAARSRLTAEVGGGKIVFPEMLEKFPEFVSNQRSLATRRKTALDDELRAMSMSLASVNDELSLLRPLAERGDVSESEILRLGGRARRA